jgi:hypothetical protein
MNDLEQQAKLEAIRLDLAELKKAIDFQKDIRLLQ